MTSTASEPGRAPDAAPGLEVATIAADALRANVTVSGPLDDAGVGLLCGVLMTHLKAGRRYLRVDLGQSGIDSQPVLDCLVRVHTEVENVGGMLTFEDVDARSATFARPSGLFVRST